MQRRFADGVLTPYPKTKRSRRRVPLTSRALAAVEALPPRVDTPLLFPASQGGYIGLDTRRIPPGRVRMGIGVDQPDRTWDGSAGSDVELGNRGVASAHDEQRACAENLPDSVLDRRMQASVVRWNDRGVAEVDDT